MPIKLIGLLVFSIISLFSLWCAAYIIAPTADYFSHENNSLLPAFIAGIVKFHAWTTIFTIFIVLTLLAFALSLFPSAARPLSVKLFSIISATSAAISLSILTASGLALKVSYSDLSSELHFYESALERYALLQSTQREFEGIHALVRSMDRLTPTEIDIKSLTRLEKRHYLSNLLIVLKEASSDSTKKMLLATSLQFRDLVVLDSSQSDKILKAAVQLHAEDTTDIEAFYAWLEKKIGTDGWTPTPLYKLIYK